MIAMVPKPSNIHKTDLLIETDWLTRHLFGAGIRIVDLRSREEYDKGHIKNTVHLRQMSRGRYLSRNLTLQR